MSCLQILGLVPPLKFQIYDRTMGEEDEMPSRTTSIQEGEDDEDITTLDTIIPSIEMQGPITKSWTRQLNH